MRFLTFCFLTLKFIGRVLFTAHVIALATLGWFLHFQYQQIGTMRPAHATSLDDWLFFAVLSTLFLCMGWLAGSEFRYAQVRTLRRTLTNEREHAAAMRRLHHAMVDDVLLAARNGLPVKSFPYSGAETEPKTAPHNVESDYIGRL
jgi:hypothetical protein